jgi:hypothetical protein
MSSPQKKPLHSYSYLNVLCLYNAQLISTFSNQHCFSIIPEECKNFHHHSSEYWFISCICLWYLWNKGMLNWYSHFQIYIVLVSSLRSAKTFTTIHQNIDLYHAFVYDICGTKVPKKCLWNKGEDYFNNTTSFFHKLLLTHSLSILQIIVQF